jgi:hypothetical protein
LSGIACERSVSSAPVVLSDLGSGNLAATEHSTAERLRSATYVSVGVGVFLCVMLVAAVRVRVTSRGSQELACVMALLLLTSALLRRQTRRTRISDLAGAFGINWLGGFVCGAIALAGLHLNFPVADPLLRSADLALGIDAVLVVDALMRQGQWLFSLMAPAYAYTIPLMTLSIFGLVLMGERSEAWRACFCFNRTLLTACLITAMVPAKGLASWFDAELLKHLPDRAARYAFQRFDQFYYGQDPELGVDAIEGVVTFPSFHMIMGLIVLAMWRKNPLALGMASGWFALMVLSTFPYGGHYAVDLVGGLIVWAAWFALSVKIERSASGLVSHGSKRSQGDNPPEFCQSRGR